MSTVDALSTQCYYTTSSFAVQSSYYELHPRRLTSPHWHEVLGHIGHKRIQHLQDNVRGALVLNPSTKAPRINQYQACALSKSVERPSRRKRVSIPTPFGHFAIDAVEFSPGYNGNRYMLHAYDLETHLNFVQTYPTSNESN